MDFQSIEQEPSAGINLTSRSTSWSKKLNHQLGSPWTWMEGGSRTAVIWLGNRVKHKMTVIEESKQRHRRGVASLEIPAIQ
jgi:hypothetical protein